MLAALHAYDTGMPNFRHDLAAGSYDTLLRSPLFDTEASTGVPCAHGMGDMLKTRAGGHGGGWDSVACPSCLPASACPCGTAARGPDRR